jgi:hypothetical protein
VYDLVILTGVACRPPPLQGLSVPPPETAPGRRKQSSKHRGVAWEKRSGKWRASIKVEGKVRHLGTFDGEEQAAAAYAAAAAAKAAGQPVPVVESPRRASASSVHKGVTYYKKSGKWRAQMMIDGTKRHLGTFVDELGAAAAYATAAAAIEQGQPVVLPTPRPTSSDCKGVCLVKASGKWQAQLWADGKMKHLGIFTEELQAAEAVALATFWRTNRKPAERCEAPEVPPQANRSIHQG